MLVFVYNRAHNVLAGAWVSQAERVAKSPPTVCT